MASIINSSLSIRQILLVFPISKGKHHCSLSVGHYELCRDDIGDLPGSPEHL